MKSDYHKNFNVGDEVYTSDPKVASKAPVKVTIIKKDDGRYLSREYYKVMLEEDCSLPQGTTLGVCAAALHSEHKDALSAVVWRMSRECIDNLLLAHEQLKKAEKCKEKASMCVKEAENGYRLLLNKESSDEDIKMFAHICVMAHSGLDRNQIIEKLKTYIEGSA